jgi:hypothetical protein
MRLTSTGSDIPALGGIPANGRFGVRRTFSLLPAATWVTVEEFKLVLEEWESFMSETPTQGAAS